MSGISLSPKRALAYPGTRLAFVDESSVAYCFGSAVRITHLLPDKVTRGFRVNGRVSCLYTAVVEHGFRVNDRVSCLYAAVIEHTRLS